MPMFQVVEASPVLRAVVVAYLAAVDRGSRQPTRDTAVALGLSYGAVRGHLCAARRSGVLGPS